MTAPMKEIGVRLAIRREGDTVRAYLALSETMENAKLLGSLIVGIAEQPQMFERWKALMTDALSCTIEQVFGQAPTITERRAPEHERSGRA